MDAKREGLWGCVILFALAFVVSFFCWLETAQSKEVKGQSRTVGNTTYSSWKADGKTTHCQSRKSGTITYTNCR